MSTGPAELLESPPARSSTPWIVVAVLAMLTLIGWNVVGPASDPAAPTAISPSLEPELPREGEWRTWQPSNYVGDLSFVDDTTGFAVLYVCSQIGRPGNDSCARRLLGTTDAGVTWETRGRIPITGPGSDALVPLSDREITLVDESNPARMLRSADGGRSWAYVAVAPAPPQVVADHAVLLPSYRVNCRERCEAELSWVDPATQRLHELLTRPPTTGTMALQPRRAVDGDIVVSGTDPVSAYVAMSTDGGQTWTESRLGKPAFVQGVEMLAAGAGRAYASIHIDDYGDGSVRVETYRTDDGGKGWTNITADQPERDWRAGAVFDGELIGATDAGVVLISSNGGTVWTELPNAPALDYVETSPDGRTLVSRPIDNWSGTPYFSLDGGTTWTRTTIPTDEGD